MALCPGGTKTNFAAVADLTVDVTSLFKSTPEEVAQDALNAFLSAPRKCTTASS
ncbi:MAG: hypothetical protein ACRCXC_08115 [Legionella sp.]